MSLNKVLLIGNVGKDPEIKYFDSNVAVANFSLATSDRGFTRGDGTVVPERTEWHSIVVWRSLVPFVEKWVRKGSSLYVEGKLRTRNYEDASGVKRYVTEVYADRIEFYSSGGRPEGGVSTASSATVGQQQQGQVVAQQAGGSPSVPEATAEDDLPF
ncbi:Helix-destabilizing protein [Bacteroidales bacterium Barb4]|nr:Helix-destabilizing protein [Bacteroidales bacterium Barb4]